MTWCSIPKAAGGLDRGPSLPAAGNAPTLGQMVRLIAGFGGFLGANTIGHPGPKQSRKACKKFEQPLPLPLRLPVPLYAGMDELWVIGCSRASPLWSEFVAPYSRHRRAITAEKLQRFRRRT